MHAFPEGRTSLTPDEMDALGAAVVRRIVRHYQELERGPVGRVAPPAELRGLAQEPLPRSPMAPAEVLDRLDRDVWSNILRIHHPRFFGFITSPSTFVGAMADALVSGLNPFAGTWLEGSGPAAVELAAVGWLREWMDLPEGWGGHFTPGGSLANLTALATARHAVLSDDASDAVLYCSDQTHSSIKRALWLLGLRKERVRALESDRLYRLDPERLIRAVDADVAAGLRPWCVVANAGATNTGAVDPLDRISPTCREHGLWLHVDGCYGLVAAFGERRRTMFAGLEGAESLSVDPHKWLFQPYECGCVMLKEPAHLPRAFQARPEYLQDAESDGGAVNFGEEGLQLTRRFRALKLWMTVKVFGADALQAAVERGIALARFAAEEISAREGWTVLAPAELGIVAFRRDVPEDGADGDALQRRIVTGLLATGFAFVSSSVLDGRVVLRMNTINPGTTEDHVRATLDHLDEVAESI